ncbi:hypothetical protein FXV83_16655 [Bradyrhizobium hipponense]|uniref:Uncharacterized protein n=1 Tax=Bradyrhizobium hipponense TaxID=2605638 RepID=A0A5S4YMB1_9BRAD|nr:hypothetical protein [Bradyrhizobium hipponense]TYO65561.1 hypothetical protein FXV83_16655 [Bradyrhizobium hipponense]
MTISRMKHVEVAKVEAGLITFQAVRLEEDNGRKHPMQFNMLVGDEIVARMGEAAARFFIEQASQVFVREYDDEWIRRSPTYAASIAAFRAAAEQRQSHEAEEAPAVSTEQHRFA